MIFERLKAIIAHPSRIGIFFKDKAYVVIIHMLAFLAMLSGVLAIKNFYKPNNFTRDTSFSVVDVIRSTMDESNCKYENYQFSGSALISGDSMTIYINREIVDKSASDFVIIISDDIVIGYFNGIKVFNDTLDEMDLANYSFEIQNIIDNKSEDKISFVEFLTPILDNFEYVYAANIFLINLGTFLAYYLGIIIFCLIFSVINNPEINMKIRIKLIIYDSLSFILFAMLSVLFSQSWLVYAGIIISAIYSLITFSHIIKVKIKKV